MKIRNHAEFDALMIDIDQVMQRKDLPISARPLHAIGEVARRTRMQIPVAGPFEMLPVPGDYTGSSLAGHIERWMEDRYGSRLKVDFSYGYTAILLRGDPWLVRVPVIWGDFEVVADRDLSKTFGGWVVNKPGEPRREVQVNILRLVQDLPQGLASVLHRSEMRELTREFMVSHDLHRDIDGYHRDDSLALAAVGDLQSGARRAVGRSDEYGLSRWDSLQAAEKFIKLFLSQRRQTFPRTHKLSELFIEAQKYGLEAPPPALIDEIQCDASVRYERTSFSPTNVVRAHRASTVVGYAVMRCLHSSPGGQM